MKGECKIYKLGDVCDVINGLWTGKKEPFINICVIRNTNFTKDCKLNLDDVAYIDAEVKQFSTRKLQVGDIIVEKSGGSDKQPVGRVVLFDVGEGDYSFSNFTSALRVKGDIDPKYLHKCLVAHYRRGETEKLQSKTTGIRNLDMKGYLRLPIPIRPLPEQERIVAELDCLSDIIEKQKQQLKELDNLAKSIFYTTFGDPISNNFGWPVKKMGEVCIVNPSKKDTSRHLVSSDIISFLPMEDLPIKACYYSPSQQRLLSEVQSSYTCFAENDILMAKVTPCFENGKVGIATKLQNGVGYGSSEFIVLRTNLSDVIKEYIYYVVQDPTFKEQACAQFTGTSGLRRVPRTFVENCTVSLPPLSLQQEFASKIETIEKQKEIIKQSITETETLFNSRMDHYFN